MAPLIKISLKIKNIYKEKRRKKKKRFWSLMLYLCYVFIDGTVVNATEQKKKTDWRI